MKLLTKLTLFITISKLAMVGLFILLLPMLVNKIGFEYTNYYLRQQQKKVIEEVREKGIDFYLQGESDYGSYTLLKEEYISLEPLTVIPSSLDTIETAARVIESDTITYRLLIHVFESKGKKYILEIGKNITTISQYNRPLQRVALYVLTALIALSLIIDLLYTRILLRPLGLIIRKKLVNQKFPFRDLDARVHTNTQDFRYLDESLSKLMSRINEDFEKEKQFTSNASHELMTPISILQSKMENLLMDETLSESSQEKLSGMMRTLNRLKRIVQSLLLISRIENEQYMRNDIIRVNNLINELQEELESRATEKEIKLLMNISGGTQLIDVNQDLIFQLFYNLFNNAIKYSNNEGSIAVTDTVTPDGRYIIRIADTGIGIPASKITTVFDRFKKGDHALEGNGLGLSIVKSIAQYHQISVELLSEEGKGTTAVITFDKTAWRR